MTNDTQSATVLIVEDEKPLADLYTLFVEPMYTVYTVYNGSDALERMSDEVDIVLLDRRMPGLSGEGVLRAIHEEGYNCAVAMLSAVSPDIDIIDMPIDSYLTKPVDKDDLIQTVESMADLYGYDPLIREYHQLESKKLALKSEKVGTDLSAHAEFNWLLKRLDILEAEIQAKSGVDLDEIPE